LRNDWYYYYNNHNKHYWYHCHPHFYRYQKKETEGDTMPWSKFVMVIDPTEMS
jgi:hypothetical protein